MISDWEVWSCAQAMLNRHGDQAPLKIAERIGALALDGDEQGVATWRRIAGAADELRKTEAPRRPSQ